MKIQRSYTDYTNLPAVRGSVNVAKPGRDTEAGDRINLSETARKLLSGAEVRSSHGVDADKVARLKAAINDGSYHVSAEKIADSMLDAVDEERA